MSRLRALLVAAFVCAAPASAVAETPPELVHVLGDFVHAINAPDDHEFVTLFTPEASITDTVYPYHWQGPDSAKHYFADLQADVKSIGWDDLRLSADGEPFVVVRPDFAYAALHLFVDYKAHNTPHQDSGIFALSLRRDGTHWKIRSATWVYTRPPERHAP